MTDLGFDRPLYILPFDHRGSFQSGLFGWKGTLTPEKTARVAASKAIIYDGLLGAVGGGVPQGRAGILVDEQFGAPILRDAQARGFLTAAPAEKSGQHEFDFEYGDDYARHIEAFSPTFCKVRVRYNPEGDAEMNRRQAARLRHLAEYLHRKGRKFMFELLVPARRRSSKSSTAISARTIGRAGRATWSTRSTSSRMRASSPTSGRSRVSIARRTARPTSLRRRAGVGCIILGRGEDEAKVESWLSTAAGVPGFIGFAVGRTTFWDALVGWRDGRTTRDAAVAEVARRYTRWCQLFAERAEGR